MKDKLGGDKPLGRIAEAVVTGAPEFMQQMNRQFTPQQEYYLGRAVAANAIAKYGLDRDERRRAYVRHVGDAIVRLARPNYIPPTFGGYHFDVLASDEVNAVSGPGGFVLVTRGAVEACRTEDELAAILSHELAHVFRRHAEAALRQSSQWQGIAQGVTRLVGAGTGLDRNGWSAQLLRLFETAVGQMAKNSVEHNYGSAAEFDADLQGTYLLMEVVYDHRALYDVLRELAKRPHAYGAGATHASPEVRAAQLQPIVAKWPTFPYGDEVLADRRARFEAALGRARAAPPR